MNAFIINYHCTKNLSCPSEYPHLNQNNKECIIGDINYIQKLIADILDDENKKTNENNSKEDENNIYDKILENIESIFTKDNYNLSGIDNGEEQIIQTEKILITLTNIDNQKHNINSNMSTIDLGKCENLLRIIIIYQIMKLYI